MAKTKTTSYAICERLGNILVTGAKHCLSLRVATLDFLAERLGHRGPHDVGGTRIALTVDQRAEALARNGRGGCFGAAGVPARGRTDAMDPNAVERERSKRRMLIGAGYEFHAVHDVWVNELLDRQLDGGIAQHLTVEQLVRWIKAGDSRMRTPALQTLQAAGSRPG
jgi:hypothetical protein